MKNSTKAAVAAAGAVALLASGAGSLAFWNATAETPGAQIHSGELKLTDSTASGCAAESFKFADGTNYVGANPGITRVVPGDVLTKTCSFKITAVGQNLSADLNAVNPTWSANSAFPLTAAASYTVDGVAASPTITSAQNGKTLEAKIVVTFPYGDSVNNLSQKTNKTLGAYTVTATQTNPAPVIN